ncbi:MAG: pitrilysin family protein [Clostridia bacterium]
MKCLKWGENMVKLITLENGLRVVLDRLESVRSTSIGIFTLQGSAYEPASLSGISHLIEHMNFKGTKTMSAREIAVFFDEMGGSCNAFTSKEMTAFYAKVIDTNGPKALSALSDMFLNSRYKKSDLESEKKVIYEEISQGEDSPEDLVLEILGKNIWKGSGISVPICGTKKALKSITSATIRSYIANNISTKNTVVSISGSFDEEEILATIKKDFANMNTNEVTISMPKADFKVTSTTKVKNLEQSHIALAFKAFDSSMEKEYYALSVLNTAFGGGMSSRLFQRIREKEGLCYSIYSYPIRYNAGGVFIIYMAVNKSNIESSIAAVNEELALLKERSITKKELARAKTQLKSGLIMSLESTSSRMMNNGKSVLLKNKVTTADDLCDIIDNVTPKDIKSVISDIINLESISKSIVT